MGLVLVLVGLTLVAVASGNRHYQPVPHSVGLTGDLNNKIDSVDNGLANTDLLLAFVVFRHGDRTPDQEELDKYPEEKLSSNIFFPYGKKALTNTGKKRGYRVGEYIRKRYNGVISQLYLPDEISIRTTNYDRTKMTVLTALAAIYPPTTAQRWNPILDWQPVPYDTPVPEDDDLLYWYECPRYLQLRNRVYDLPEVQKLLQPYEGLFNFLTQKTGSNITTSEDVFFLDNLFQALQNVGVEPPQWALEVMPRIKEVTKIEYACELYNSDLIRLATGRLMYDFFNATNAIIAGDKSQKRLHLISAHENNVASLLAGARVFIPHQPNYGATVSLELRRRRLTGQFGITAVYAPDAGGPGLVLPIPGCGGQPLCDYDTFVNLTQDVVMTPSEYRRECDLSV